MRELGRPIALALLATIGIVSLWTPLAHPEIAARWFTLPSLFFFAQVPVLVLVATWALDANALRKGVGQSSEARLCAIGHEREGPCHNPRQHLQ